MKGYVAQEDVAQRVPLVEWLAGSAGAAQAPPGGSSAGAVVRSPGIPDLVGPVPVVGPGVEVAGYRSLAGACALHAIQPVCVRFRARRRSVARGRRVARRARRLVSPPVARAHEVKLLM